MLKSTKKMTAEEYSLIVAETKREILEHASELVRKKMKKMGAEMTEVRAISQSLNDAATAAQYDLLHLISTDVNGLMSTMIVNAQADLEREIRDQKFVEVTTTGGGKTLIAVASITRLELADNLEVLLHYEEGGEAYTVKVRESYKALKASIG